MRRPGLLGRAFVAIARIPSRAAARAGRVPRSRRRTSTVVLALLVVAVAAATVVVAYLARDAQLRADARTDAVVAARQRVARVLSYDHHTIDTDIESARADTAGAFAQYYVPFAQRMIAPAVRQQRTRSTTVVARAAPITITPDRVDVLLFIDQQTSSDAQPQPRATSSTAEVTMTKVAGQWLISELKPTAP